MQLLWKILLAGLFAVQVTFAESKNLTTTIDRANKSPLTASIRRLKIHLSADYDMQVFDDLDSDSPMTAANVEELAYGIQPLLKMSYPLTKRFEYGVMMKLDARNQEPNWFCFLSVSF